MVLADANSKQYKHLTGMNNFSVMSADNGSVPNLFLQYYGLMGLLLSVLSSEHCPDRLNILPSSMCKSLAR
jgi:hypothetical protein